MIFTRLEEADMSPIFDTAFCRLLGSVGLICDVLPAGEIVRRLADEAVAALEAGARLIMG